MRGILRVASSRSVCINLLIYIYTACNRGSIGVSLTCYYNRTSRVLCMAMRRFCSTAGWFKFSCKLTHNGGRHCLQAGERTSSLIKYQIAMIVITRATLCQRSIGRVASRCSVETAGRIGLGFFWKRGFRWTRATYLHENSTFSKNKGTSLWNSVPKSGLIENFATAIRLSQRVAILARQRWTLPR